MTDLHEHEVEPGLNYLSLAEVEDIGPGAVYEVLGSNIEPVGVYEGDGMFAGVYERGSGKFQTVHLSREEHHDHQPGSSLWPLRHLESLGRLDLNDRPALRAKLTDLVRQYYDRELATALAQTPGPDERFTPHNLTLDELRRQRDLFAMFAIRLY